MPGGSRVMGPRTDSMDTPRRVAAIVVNYSTPELTAACVGHLRAQDTAQLDVVVVDNASSAAQLDCLRHLLPEERIIETGRNLGFADGLNAGMHYAWALNPDFLWMVTPDAKADPGCLSAMVDAMDRDKGLGICGPVIDAAGEWIVGCRLIEPLGFLVRIKSARAARIDALPGAVATDFVEGCSMLIRADTARQVGLFRPEFFLYYEECEYCLRARDLGWRLAVIPAARVRTRARKVERNARSYYLIRNSIVLARLRRKHVATAVVRGIVETAVHATRQPTFLAAGLRAVRDGLSLTLSSERGVLR
jgi:GT2 family glycosyltransferase